jgi:hypothetical protein
MTATYLYAIISAENEAIFDVDGMGDHDDEVCAIPNGDIAAVVGASPLTDYRGLKRNEAAAYLVAHQRVVEAVMQDFPTLPVKFGAVLPDESWVSRLLVQGKALFRSALARYADLTQMEVVVLWDLQQVFQEIGQEEDILQLKARLAGQPPDETVAERVAVGQKVQASLKRRRAALREQLLSPLQEVAWDLVINPIMDDSMVVNAALLMNRASNGVLDQQLAMLDEAFEGKLTFRCVGPMPPYSFATVTVQRPSFEAIDAARRDLKLGEVADSGEVKRAFHRLVNEVHPDHNPRDPEAEARTASLTQAYRLLTTYAASQVSGGASMSCSFCQEAVEQTLLIAIKRQEFLA